MPSTPLHRALVLSLIVVALSPALGASAATARPNLVVTRVGVSDTSLTPGDSVTVSDRTKNKGSVKASKSVTAFVLSKDARVSADDTRLGSRKVPSLAAGKSSAEKLVVTIPPGQPVGTYVVIACADRKKKLREQKEKDNCRASKQLTLTSTPPPPPPPPDATTSEQLAAARAAADGPVSLAVVGAVVTYVKPALGADAAGFFVQGDQAGPALFIAVDPATLSPVPAVGDRVSFTVTQMGTTATLRYAASISDYARTATGVDTATLRQDVTAATDVVSGVGGYESELVGLTGSISSGFVAAGSGHVSASLATAGAPAEPNLRLRLPTALRDELQLEQGCAVTLAGGPMWRFNAVAQPSAYAAQDLQVDSCPAPTVVSATAPSATSVVVTFSRAIDPASVASNGSQFVVDNGLAISAASVSGNAVTLTSSVQAATSYTVTVASSVTDTLGTGVGTPNAAQFDGFVPAAALVLNEVSPNIASARDLIELKVVTAGSTDGVTVVQDGSTTEVLATLPDLTVGVGDLVVVHLNASGAAGAAPASETTAANQYPAASFGANYDSAWDVHGADIGVTFNHRVLLVKGVGGVVQDAVPFVLTSSPSPPAAFPSDLQAIQASGHWLPADCGGQPCDYASTPTAPAVAVAYDGAGTTPAGSSVSRKPTADTDQKADWYIAGPSSLGAPNP